MLIREWMAKDIVTVGSDTSMLKANKIMKTHDIRRLPVVDSENRVIGIVSDRDIKAASPSKATTLDAHELSYLLSELKIKDIMTRDPITVKPTDTIESAAVILEERDFGGLPVVDDANKVVGIITDHDIFKIMVDISGARIHGLKLAFSMPDEPGVLQSILALIFEMKGNICSVLASRNNATGNMSHVFIRLHPMPKDDEAALISAVREKFPLEYYVDDRLHEI